MLDFQETSIGKAKLCGHPSGKILLQLEFVLQSSTWKAISNRIFRCTAERRRLFMPTRVSTTRIGKMHSPISNYLGELSARTSPQKESWRIMFTLEIVFRLVRRSSS